MLTLFSMGDFTDAFSMGGGGGTLYAPSPIQLSILILKVVATIPPYTLSLSLIFNWKIISVLIMFGLKRPWTLTLLKIFEPKSSYFNMFKTFLQKWTPRTLFALFTIVIPNTPYVIFFTYHCLYGGVPKIRFFMVSKNYFNWGLIEDFFVKSKKI